MRVLLMDEYHVITPEGVSLSAEPTVKLTNELVAKIKGAITEGWLTQAARVEAGEESADDQHFTPPAL